MSSLHDPALARLFEEDREILATTQVPMVTVAGTFKEDLKNWYGLPNENITSDVVFSRAHFSMAYGVMRAAWGEKLNQQKAWMVDPTNYVSSKNWRNIALTEDIGQTIARHPFLQLIKSIIDKFGRQKLPILKSITPPLLYLYEGVDKPILSFHIAAGNVLSGLGKSIVQMVTDPHIRDEYLANIEKDNFFLLVFDEETKFTALEKAILLGKDLDPDKVIITGPPIDERIIEIGHKKAYRKIGSPLRLLLTTGGLGTNKGEIRSILTQLLPLLRKKKLPVEVMLYAGTQKDFFEMGQELAAENRVKLPIIYHPQIFNANELLIKEGLPWADGVMSKPSGDMAYDAITAGCFLLTLSPWGEWEERIQERMFQWEVARKAQVNNIVEQLHALVLKSSQSDSWIAQAKDNLRNLDPLLTSGASNILKAYRKLSK